MHSIRPLLVPTLMATLEVSVLCILGMRSTLAHLTSLSLVLFWIFLIKSYATSCDYPTCLFGTCGMCSWLRYCTGILTRVSVGFESWCSVFDFGPTFLINPGLMALIVWSAVFYIEESNPEILVCNNSGVNDFCDLTSLESARILPLLDLALFSLIASVWRGIALTACCDENQSTWPFSCTISDLSALLVCLGLKPPFATPWFTIWHFCFMSVAWSGAGFSLMAESATLEAKPN